MSFWNFVKDIAPAALSAGASVYGAAQQNRTTAQAANQANQAAQRAMEAELQALEQANRIAQANQQQASSGVRGLQEQVSRGARLTPEQEMAVEDTRRKTLDALQGGGLRGSARATSAALSDADARTRNNFMTQNQRQSDDAARSLSGQYFNSGSQMINIANNQGQSQSRGLLQQGNNTANATIGTGNTIGRAIGDVGAIASDLVKSEIQKSRDSSYKKVE